MILIEEIFMILKIIITLIGITTVIGSLFHNKEKHKRFGENTSTTATSDSLIATIIGLLIAFLLSIMPWWLTKYLFILLGICLIYIGVFLI